MRNYTTMYFAEVTATLLPNPPGGNFIRVFGGQFEGQASFAAQNYASLLDPMQYTDIVANPEEIRYVLLSRDLVSGYFINLINYNAINGQQIRQSIDDITTGYGLDIGVSPKLQRVRPWNGRKGRGF